MSKINLNTVYDKEPISYQSRAEIRIETAGRSLTEFTGDLASWVAGSGIENGLATLFVRHTSASLLIQENADPSVCTDLLAAFQKFAPDGLADYRHSSEGPDDMPSHIRSALTQTHLAIPVHGGKLALGTWQGIYLFEHRIRPHQRTVLIDLQGR